MSRKLHLTVVQGSTCKRLQEVRYSSLPEARKQFDRLAKQHMLDRDMGVFLDDIYQEDENGMAGRAVAAKYRLSTEIHLFPRYHDLER